MTTEEIFKYIKVGKSKSISVHRCLLEQYPGIIRNVIIRPEVKLQIDYFDKHTLEIGEGEITLYFYYEDYNKLFTAVENLIGIKMDKWEKNTKSDWNFEIVEHNLKKSWKKLESDFVDKILHLPKGYKEFGIRDLYWKALASGEVNVNDEMNVFEQWLEKKMLEEDEMYGDN